MAVPAISPTHRIAGHLKKLSRYFFRFRARTRVILTFLGSIAIIGSWVMPWYDNLYWLNSAAAEQVALNTGYEFTNLMPGDPLAKKYGLNVLTDEYTGDRLAHGSAYMQSLGFSQQDFYWWVALAVLSLIALKTFEWRDQNRLRDIVSRVIEGAKAIALIWTIAVCVWRAFNFTSLAHVQSLAQSTLLADLKAHGITNPGLQHTNTSFSQGVLSLFLGLILCFLGVFSATNTKPRKPRWWRRKGVPAPSEPVLAADGRVAGAPTEIEDQIRVTAGVFALAAIIFLVLAISVLG
jgi:hypothetical protein